MSLDDFYARITPLLLGQQAHAEAVAALYSPEARTSPDAERLRIYQRFCRTHRFEAVDYVYVETRAWVLRHAGEAAWEDLVTAYFAAHPMHHFELNQNGEHLPQFLSDIHQRGGADALPAFLSELADFEWWEWLVSIAPDDPADAEPEAGPLRLGSTVEIRPYKHDLLGWLDPDGAEDRPRLPEPAETLVLFWRDRDLDARRDAVSALELQIIKAVVEGIPLTPELAGRIGVDPADLVETAHDLHRAGILLGDPRHLPLE
jgi:hypothetical protein